MATHSSFLAWRLPGMGEPGGLPSMGSHRVGHNWSDLAAVAAVRHEFVSTSLQLKSVPSGLKIEFEISVLCTCLSLWTRYLNHWSGTGGWGQWLAFLRVKLHLELLNVQLMQDGLPRLPHINNFTENFQLKDPFLVVIVTIIFDFVNPDYFKSSLIFPCVEKNYGWSPINKSLGPPL